MSASEESLALVEIALEEEEEESDFVLLNFQAKHMETDLVQIHEDYLIPSKF